MFPAMACWTMADSLLFTSGASVLPGLASFGARESSPRGLSLHIVIDSFGTPTVLPIFNELACNAPIPLLLKCLSLGFISELLTSCASQEPARPRTIR